MTHADGELEELQETTGITLPSWCINYSCLEPPSSKIELNLEEGDAMNTRIYIVSHRSVIPYVQCGSMFLLLISGL
jgi:hypothetical protein